MWVNSLQTVKIKKQNKKKYEMCVSTIKSTLSLYNETYYQHEKFSLSQELDMHLETKFFDWKMSMWSDEKSHVSLMVSFPPGNKTS